MEEVTKEDIEMAVDKVSYHVAARMKERDLDEEKEMMSLEGTGFYSVCYRRMGKQMLGD